MSDDILYEAHGHVRLITLNRPAKMNSLDFEANDALVERWKEFDADPEARVAVVTGAGDQAFCAGADLKTYTMAFAQTPAPEFSRKYTNGPGFGGITRTLNIFKPIVAAVNGYAVSGGLELALACDIRLCSPNAEFGLQDVRWGFHACDGGLIRLKEIVGLGNALEMVLSRRPLRCRTRVSDRTRQPHRGAGAVARRDPCPCREARLARPARATARQGSRASRSRIADGRGAQARIDVVPQPRAHRGSGGGERGVPGTQAGPVQVALKDVGTDAHGPSSGALPRPAQAASFRCESSTRTCCGAPIVRTMSSPLYDCTSKNWRT